MSRLALVRIDVPFSSQLLWRTLLRSTSNKASKKTATDDKLEDVLKISDGKIIKPEAKPKKEPKAKKEPGEKKVKKIKDPNEPKRPSTAYALWMKDHLCV